MTVKNRDCERCRQVKHVWRKCPCVCEAKCGHPACNGKEPCGNCGGLELGCCQATVMYR